MRKLEYGNGFDMDAQMKQSGPESCGQTQANGDISRDFNKVDRIRTIVRKIKTPRSARADIELTVGRGEFKVEGVVLRNRGKNSGVEHWFKSVIHSDGQIYAIESTLDPGSCVFDGPYWDVFLVVAKDNVQYYIDVEIPKNIKRAMLFTNKQCVLEDGKILFGDLTVPEAVKRAVLEETGDNPDMVRSSSINPAFTTIVGLCISNSFTALSGCLLAQSQKSVNIDIGSGMVTIALASLLIGRAFAGRGGIPRRACGAVIGAIIFRLVYAAALRFHMPAFMLKLVSSVIVIIAIAGPYLKSRYPEFHRRMTHKAGKEDL